MRSEAIMLTLPRWLAPPIHSDTEDNRSAHLLAALLAVVNSLNVIILTATLLTTPEQTHFIIVFLLLTITFSAAQIALKHGAPPRPIARMVVGIFWLTTFAVSIRSGAVTAMNLSAQVVIIVVAALMLTGRDVIFFTLLSLIAGFGLSAGQLWGGIVPPSIPESPLITWLFQSGVLVFTGILLYWTFGQFTALLQQARSQEQSLAQRNAALECEIAERNKAEKALHASEQRLKLAMQVARMGTWDWNLVTDEDNWDEKTHQLFDVPLGEFEPSVDSFSAQVDSADKDAVAQMLAACRETGAPFDLEYRVRHRDGQTRWLHSLGHTYFDEAGKPHFMVGIVQDITERKDAETALRASEQRLKLAMQMARMGMWDWNIETDVEIWDEMTHALFGVPVGAFNTTMDVFAALVDPDDQQAVDEMVSICRDTGAPFDMQYRLVRADGQRRWMHSLGQIYFDSEGKPQHMVGVVQDITERKQAEQQQLDLALERERVQLLKNVLHTMSHDLKTPLAAINTSLYLLERATSDEQRQPRIDSIKEQVTQLDKLIQDILTLARLDHTPQLKVDSVDLNGLIESAVHLLRASAERKHIGVQLTLASDIEPVAADRGEIQRVLVNLIENAINYTPEEGSVRVRSSISNDSATIEISDTGIGIHADDLPNIFDRFYRANDARAAVEGGTGLGLAIVKQIIDMHSGSIEVESQRGRGTTFRVKLPLHHAQPVAQ